MQKCFFFFVGCRDLLFPGKLEIGFSLCITYWQKKPCKIIVFWMPVIFSLHNKLFPTVCRNSLSGEVPRALKLNFVWSHGSLRVSSLSEGNMGAVSYISQKKKILIVVDKFRMTCSMPLVSVLTMCELIYLIYWPVVLGTRTWKPILGDKRDKMSKHFQERKFTKEGLSCYVWTTFQITPRTLNWAKFMVFDWAPETRGQDTRWIEWPAIWKWDR